MDVSAGVLQMLFLSMTAHSINDCTDSILLLLQPSSLPQIFWSTRKRKEKLKSYPSLRIQSANAWYMCRVNISDISERAMIYLMNCETGTSAYSQDFHLKGTKFWSYMLSLGRLRLLDTDYRPDSLTYSFS